MEKVKNKKTGIVKEIPEEILSDYLSTKEWEVVKDKKDNSTVKSKVSDEIELKVSDEIKSEIKN